MKSSSFALRVENARQKKEHGICIDADLFFSYREIFDTFLFRLVRRKISARQSVTTKATNFLSPVYEILKRSRKPPKLLKQNSSHRLYGIPAN